MAEQQAKKPMWRRKRRLAGSVATARVKPHSADCDTEVSPTAAPELSAGPSTAFEPQTLPSSQTNEELSASESESESENERGDSEQL